MSMHGKFFPFLIGILLLSWSMPFLMADTVVRFPTENTALLDNRPQDFYMYVDRNFEGVKSQPWQAGAYGFTRTLVRTQAGPVAVKFHESSLSNGMPPAHRWTMCTPWPGEPWSTPPPTPRTAITAATWSLNTVRRTARFTACTPIWRPSPARKGTK